MRPFVKILLQLLSFFLYSPTRLSVFVVPHFKLRFLQEQVPEPSSGALPVGGP